VNAEYCRHPLGREPMPQCRAYAPNYRQCAQGCKQIIAYCPEHGGDARAIEEMTAHHKTHPDPDDLFCPRHGKASRPIEIPGLRCDNNTPACKEQK
jgi:hypothetical protein